MAGGSGRASWITLGYIDQAKHVLSDHHGPWGWTMGLWRSHLPGCQRPMGALTAKLVVRRNYVTSYDAAKSKLIHANEIPH